MKKVQLVGILNVTPDSFSDGGEFNSTGSALEQAEKLFADGADIVDVGGESTNPWSTAITAEDEWNRIKDILSVLIPKYPGKISVDSHHPETLRQVAQIGPFIINDVTGFNNPAMIKLAVELQLPIIVSHLPAKFGSDIAVAHKSLEPFTTVDQVKTELLAKEAELIQAGVKLENIILDPGIGFGKTMGLNAELVEFASEVPGKPVMIGYSRKRFLGENRMEIEPNLAAGKRASNAGATYLRIHDVLSHKNFIELYAERIAFE